jgi:hypothetical protein
MRIRNLVLIVLFGIICLLSMNLGFAYVTDTDHDNLSMPVAVPDVSAQTQMYVQWEDPMIYCGPYATVWNSSNVLVRYYFNASHVVVRGQRVYKQRGKAEKGWIAVGEGKSFYPTPLDINMATARNGKYTANAEVDLLLKFDHNLDGTFDETATVDSSVSIEFRIEDDD